jgi:hypothetical protein
VYRLLLSVNISYFLELCEFKTRGRQIRNLLTSHEKEIPSFYTVTTEVCLGRQESIRAEAEVAAGCLDVDYLKIHFQLLVENTIK